MAPDSRVDVVDDDDVGDGPVSREKYQSKLCKIDELNQIIEGLFANEIKQISLREEVEKLRNEKEEAESTCSEAVSRYKSEIVDISSTYAAEIDAMQSEHALMVAELETSYEARLVLQATKIATMENEHQATEQTWLKEMSEKDEQQQAQIAELALSSQSSENKLKEEISSLKDEVNTSEKMRKAILNQQEEEYESELSHRSQEHRQRLQGKQTSIDEVNVSVQKLLAKKAWLEKQAKELKAQVIDIQNERLEETQRCKKLDGEIGRMKLVLNEKDETIAQMKAENNTTNMEKTHLEKELYITRTKCEELEAEQAPLGQTIKGQREVAASLTKQLNESHSEKDALHQQIEVQEQKVKSRDSEIKSQRGTIRNRDRRLKSMEGEMVHLAGITDEKELQKSIKIAYQKLNINKL